MAARHRTLPRSSRTRRATGKPSGGAPPATGGAARTPLQRDLLAMARVWGMLRTGTARWIGEIGRRH